MALVLVGPHHQNIQLAKRAENESSNEKGRAFCQAEPRVWQAAEQGKGRTEIDGSRQEKNFPILVIANLRLA